MRWDRAWFGVQASEVGSMGITEHHISPILHHIIIVMKNKLGVTRYIKE